MSKNKKKKVKVAANTLKPTESRVTSTKVKKTAVAKSTTPLLFGRQNYILILAGVGLILLGLLLMSGGSMPDNNTWDESIIYSTRRTLIAPIFILAGLAVEIYALFKK